MINRNFLRNSFPREKKGARRKFNFCTPGSWCLSFHQMTSVKKTRASVTLGHLGKISSPDGRSPINSIFQTLLYITVPMTNGQCSTNSVVPWETQSGRSIAELVLPVTGKYSHKYLHYVWADACITQQLLCNSVPSAAWCRVRVKENAWN